MPDPEALPGSRLLLQRVLARTQPPTHPAAHHSPKPKSPGEEEGLGCRGDENLPRATPESLRPGSHGRRQGGGEYRDNVESRTYKATGKQRPHEILLKHSPKRCEEGPLLPQGDPQPKGFKVRMHKINTLPGCPLCQQALYKTAFFPHTERAPRSPCQGEYFKALPWRQLLEPPSTISTLRQLKKYPLKVSP